MMPGLGGQQPPPQNAVPAAPLVPGIQAGTQARIVTKQLIIIGSSGELLVYDTMAAKGTLIGSISAVAGTDPYGNNFPAGMAFGVWSASSGGQLQSFSVDPNGNLSVADAAGKTVTYIESSTGTVLVYTSAGVSAGALIASFAPAAGTDPAGNPYIEGVTAYQWVSGQQYAESLSTEIESSAALSFQNMSSPGTLNPAIYGNAESGSGTFDQVVVSSGSSTGSGGSSVTCQDQTLGGNILTQARNFTLDANSLTLPSGFTISMTGGELNAVGGLLNIQMGGIAGYPTSGTSLANTQAALDQLIGEMINRLMIA